MSEVICAEREELRRLGDLAGFERGARQLDHRAYHVVKLTAAFAKHLRRDRIDTRLDGFQLLLRDHERDHDFRNGGRALLGHITRRLKHGARLHLVDLRIDDREPATAEAEHRVALRQRLNPRGKPIGRDTKRRRDIGDVFFRMRQELMQRRIKKPDRHRPRTHRFEDADKVGALVREQFFERLHARRFCLSHNHLAH